MIEWKRDNEFNSFNSYKGLLYAPWYQAIANHRFLPPIEASFDPIHECNLSCKHCNAGRFVRHKDSAMTRMPDEHMIKLVGFLGTWGVKSVCFGGGGESTLHSALPQAIAKTIQCGMGAGIITNLTVMYDALFEALLLCRFIGVSVDAGSRKTYRSGKGRDLFDAVINHIDVIQTAIRMCNLNCDIGYKFLIFDYNQHEIFKACKIAKSLGVKDFHARPADLTHQGMETKSKSKYNLRSINNQFQKCHELEDDTFRVFTVMHKYDDTLKPKKNFSQCYGAPVCIQLCADGNVYLCVDTRHIEYYKLGAHYPDPANILNFWGKERHQKLVFETGKQNCTSRCTYGHYCRQCEKLFINKDDPMCKWFT